MRARSAIALLLGGLSLGPVASQAGNVASALHGSAAVQGLLAATATRSATARRIYDAVAAGPFYVYFTARPPLLGHRAEVEVHGVDPRSGRVVAHVLFAPEVETAARRGRVNALDAATLFHELYHVVELGGALTGAASDAGRAPGEERHAADLARGLVRDGRARRSGVDRIETAAAAAVTEAVSAELVPGGDVLVATAAPAPRGEGSVAGRRETPLELGDAALAQPLAQERRREAEGAVEHGGEVAVAGEAELHSHGGEVAAPSRRGDLGQRRMQA